MEISPYLLAKMLAYSFLLGAGLGVLYDAFRIFRILSATGSVSECDGKGYDGVMLSLPPPMSGVFGKKIKPFFVPASGSRSRAGSVIYGILLFFEDILFFAVCGCAVSVLIYYTNDGRFRLMAVVGVFVGFLLYYLTVGRLVLSAARFICFAIRAVLTYLTLALVTPFAYLLKAVRYAVTRTVGRIRAVYVRKKNKKYDRSVRDALRLEAERGFLYFGITDNYENKKVKIKEKRKCVTKKKQHQKT